MGFSVPAHVYVAIFMNGRYFTFNLNTTGVWPPHDVQIVCALALL
jgi:hypothetical protein